MTYSAETSTLFQRVGGMQFFLDLVEKFYQGVENDPILRPLYPEDLGPGKAHLALFLGQYWGGPRQYEMERGHPRLRMRHAPFAIHRVERDAWMGHMTDAVAESGASPQDTSLLMGYFDDAATFMINREG
jgi:hemoglobin